MQIYTLNVGEGQFVVVTSNTEAFIVDTFVPLNPEMSIVNVKAALSKILNGKELGHVRKFVFRGFGYVLVWGCFFD
jgi:hypothetical protein